MGLKKFSDFVTDPIVEKSDCDKKDDKIEKIEKLVNSVGIIPEEDRMYIERIFEDKEVESYDKILKKYKL